MRTSYSALETYKLCPQKYKFQEIDRIRAKKSSAALFGTKLHAALKFMFSQDPLFPTLDQVMDFFRTEWQNAQSTSIRALNEAEKQLYQNEGERILKNFYAKHPPWISPVVDLESYFEVLIEDPARRETHVLAGRIDRIDKTETGYEVIDYKTARRLPSQADVDRDLQLSIYALGLERRWPHVKPEQISLSLYFLKHGEKLSTSRTAEATAATAEDVLTTVSKIGDTIASGKRFEPTPGPHCGFCPYQAICPAWKHLYRNRGAAPPPDEADTLLKEYFEIVNRTRADDGRLSEIKAQLALYMDAKGLDRLFADEGYVARTHQQRFSYDFGKVRAVLEPLGKWEAVLAADEKKLKAILKTLPPEVARELESARVLSREYTVMTTSLKRVTPVAEGALIEPESTEAV